MVEVWKQKQRVVFDYTGCCCGQHGSTSPVIVSHSTFTFTACRSVAPKYVLIVEVNIHDTFKISYKDRKEKMHLQDHKALYRFRREQR